MVLGDAGKGRLTAGLIALIAGLTLLLRLVLRTEETGSAIEAKSYLSQFFTILTNMLVFSAMSAIALGARPIPRPLLALTIAITGVGIVYHLALAHLLDLSGLALVADQGVHTIVPALTVLGWLLFASKPRFVKTDLLVWIAWPLIYCGYVLARGYQSSFYPYPFLNLDVLGPIGVLQSIVGLSLAFIVIGFVILGLGRVFSRFASN